MLGRKLKPNENAAENFNTPVILGAIAAFNKNYFWSIGGYDPGLEVWGGEYRTSSMYILNLTKKKY